MDSSRKEIVKRAIHFKNPGRIPKFFFNGDLSRSDIVQVVLEDWYLGEKKDETEWGFSWNRDLEDDSSMGVPRTNPLADWSALETYKAALAPNPQAASRFRRLGDIDVGDRYLLGSLYLTGFTVMTFLRGFEQMMADFYEEPEVIEALADLVFGIENEIIRQMPQYGFDGVALYDDLGMQTSLLVSPNLWRKYIKPRMEEQCRLIHSLGMDVFLHTCGNVRLLLEDFVEMGIDILNLGQTDLNGLDNLRDNFKGRICFCQCINYQTTGITGTREEILAEGRELRETLSSPEGGLICMLFDYEGMGWKPRDPMNTQYQIQAFLD